MMKRRAGVAVTTLKVVAVLLAIALAVPVGCACVVTACRYTADPAVSGDR